MAAVFSPAFLYICFLRLGQTGKRICYGGKTDKTCRIWLSGDKIHLLRRSPHNDLTSNGRLCPFCPVESFEHAQNFQLEETDITGHRQTRSGCTGQKMNINRI